jgi:hypothetical protein
MAKPEGGELKSERRRKAPVPFLVFLLLASLAPARADYTALVDPNVVVVTNFEGWGTSLCWWANVIGGYPNRETYADLAFSQLKLNIVRYNIGGGENPTNNFLSFRAQMPGFEPTNGFWNGARTPTSGGCSRPPWPGAWTMSRPLPTRRPGG